MNESILDFASQASSELLEAMVIASPEERDDLMLEHIKKLSATDTCVLDPNETCEWVTVTGFGNKETLSWYCTGRVALIDFFTYCCINCQHVLPDLKDLEQLYRGNDGLVVVGVHSAKFEAERVAENVLQAAQRLGVSHPIINDPHAKLWNRLGIHCWPTLLLLNPLGVPILVLAGEGYRDILFRCVSVALKYFKEAGKLVRKYIPPQPTFTIPLFQNNLRFPGKIILNPFVVGLEGEPWITISDSGNNRVLLADSEYNIIHVIGGLEPGLKDGNFHMAKLNNPQGVCWLNETSLVICDTGNHILRRADLTSKNVEIFAGTGVQCEFGDQGGLKYCQQSLSSPWDIVLYKTPDMDMSVRLSPETADDAKSEGSKSDDQRRVLLIASAGSHQIWALFLDTTIWWKYKTYEEGTLIAIVGSGREENRNNRYPNAAGLAQPSGLCLNGSSLYIADSESSTVRRLDLASGQVHPLVGGDRNPCNLFAFGDIDSNGYNARLQHPLDVACCPRTQKLYVADTYNHKIKYIDTANGNCTTLIPYPDSGTVLSEPGGLCVLSAGTIIYIADTNSDRIVSVHLDTKETQVLKFVFPQKEKEEPIVNPPPIYFMTEFRASSLKGSKLILNLNCEADDDVSLTPKAPQRWSVKFFGQDSLKTELINEWDVLRAVRDGRELPARFEASLKVNSVPKNVERVVQTEFFISLCDGGRCFIKHISINFLLLLKPEFNNPAIYDIVCTIDAAQDVKFCVNEGSY